MTALGATSPFAVGSAKVGSPPDASNRPDRHERRVCPASRPFTGPRCHRRSSTLNGHSTLLYSITSSACVSSNCGTVRPSALAVLEVNDQLELGRPFDWKVAGLCAFLEFYLHKVPRAESYR